jgi:hypothetical protein
MTPAEKQLLEALETNVDSFDQYFDESNADAPVVTTRPTKTTMGKARGNPTFSAQFDISMYLKYFDNTTSGGAYAALAAASLPAALKTYLPVYLFGQSDFAAGYAAIKRAFPVTIWTAGNPFIYGKVSDISPALDSTVTAQLVLGDMVFPFTSALPGTGHTTLGLVIVRCTQVAYATLLTALSSDRFVLNMIRYVIPDTTLIAQYSNNIGLFRQSLFGKFNSDYMSPNSFKKPEQQQNGLIDIPLKKGIDKETSMGMYINYTCIELSWSIFVWTVKKLSA